MTKDIPVKAAGGFADSAMQDSFCIGNDLHHLAASTTSPATATSSRPRPPTAP